MKTNLKPCPFCGGASIRYSHALEGLYCDHCGTVMPSVTKKLAIERWNFRTDDCRADNAELAPCPFCGQKANILDVDGDYPLVECSNCGAIGPTAPEDACVSWNRRGDK